MSLNLLNWRNLPFSKIMNHAHRVMSCASNKKKLRDSFDKKDLAKIFVKIHSGQPRKRRGNLPVAVRPLLLSAAAGATGLRPRGFGRKTGDCQAVKKKPWIPTRSTWPSNFSIYPYCPTNSAVDLMNQSYLFSNVNML